MDRLIRTEFDWEYRKNQHDIIPGVRNEYLNRCSDLSCMQHTLVAAFEAKDDNRLKFKVLEILYAEGDEFRIGNQAWERIMIYLQNFGPVPATMKHFSDYYPPAFDHKKYIYKGVAIPGERVKYHCILLLGYNSQRRYFSYLNSWGSDFGNNGRAFVDFKNIVRAYAPLFEEDQQYFEDSQMIMGRDPLPAPALIQN
ncbi:hypothetical protein PIB30_020856 [Stylosanthes scabra]|uniref:Peptidase C1A papain C-terminal domain-containing protein n=1 Tax=Stylosanthes scabra TaxID=79078 RepID=A0ABU6V6V2_9FABA|nr:hypothetical protein [Stylosanthes scabra]